MPSKEELFVDGCSATTQDFLSRDVDELVKEIKENLRLQRKQQRRPTPYRVPPRDGAKCHSCGSPRCARTCLKKPRTDASDPYELLQILLEEGGLIKEAVKRLQEGSLVKGEKEKLFYDCDTPLNNVDFNLNV